MSVDDANTGRSALPMYMEILLFSDHSLATGRVYTGDLDRSCRAL